MIVTTLTGSAKAGFADGPLSEALLREPRGLAFAGALYVADSGNDAIIRIDAAVSITSVDPQFGPAAGGTEVHLFGGGFVPGVTSVAFGNTPAALISYLNSSELIVTTPALDAGIFDVTATTSGGSATLSAAFATIPPPTIATVLPTKGPTSGGQSITITGANFTTDTTVSFGGVAATGVVILSSNSLTATTPPNGAGIVDVTVITRGGSATRSAAFSYFAPPAISNVSPMQGSAGTVVTINGVNFDTEVLGNAVFFGSRRAAVSAASSSQLIVTVPVGATTGRITVTTAGGTAISSADFSTTTYTSLELTAPVTSFDQGDAVPFNAIARLLDGSAADVSAQALWSTSDANVATVANGSVTGRAAGAATITATFSGFAASRSIVIRIATIPVAVPTPTDESVVQPLADSIRFLYAGPNAVQTGVAANAINDDRVTTARGSVHTREGAPLAGVEVSVAGHPELGHTFTRADGRFDLAFNGGGALTLRYRKAAWLEAQRLLSSLWNEQKVIDDVVLIPFDSNGSLVTMGNPAVQTARGTAATDADGTRTATIIIPSGETATVITPDGVVSNPTFLHLRATEYTVGASGLHAMPAPLPPYSGYTYCVELSADEANGGSVQYSRPVSVYLENFLSLPAGTKIPAAFYDRANQRWVATSNGRVVRIVAVNNGIAAIDANGDGSADTDAALAVLGIDEGERRALASLYPAGQSLWRVRTNHFSSLDCNFEIIGPLNAKKPKARPAKRRIGSTATRCTARDWSIVDCANQSLRESIPIQGTPYAIEYDSSRSTRNQYSTEIALSDADSVVDSLRRIDLRVRIAGQEHLYHFAPQPNLKYTFTWDGRDGFGRPVQGAQNATIDITHAYPVRYVYPEGDPAWNMPAEVIDIIERERVEYTLTESSEVMLGHFGSSNTGFGGWTFSPQRFYDGVGRTIYEAEGRQRSTDPQQTRNTAITTLPVGDPDSLDLFTMAPAPDGSLYFSDGYKIRMLAADGTIADVAGRTTSGFTPDGQMALGNPLNLWQFASGPDGTLYVIDATRVRTIVNGRWVTVAGNSTFEQGVQPEGVQATSRSITAWSLTVAPNGTVFVGGLGNIYKIDPDGILHTIAGTPQASTFVEFTDGALARSVRLGRCNSLAVGPNGTLYFTNGKILGRVTTDGRVFHVLTASSGFFAQGVAVTGDGTVLVGNVSGKKVLAIAPDGSTTTFAGTGQFDKDAPPLTAGMSRSFPLLTPIEAKVAADGSVLILDWDTESIRRAASAFPAVRAGVPALIPSNGGSLAYIFENGRHARTVNVMTGATLQSLGYDTAGHLVTVTDVDGLVTSVQRDSSGEPTSIVAPNGQRTTLSVSDGRIQSVTGPSGETQILNYGSDGLLSQLVDRRGGQHNFTYDDEGLLIRDQDPVGGFISLSRIGTGSTFGVTRTSAEGRTQSFANAVDSLGMEIQSSVGMTGLAMASASFGATSTMSSPALSISAEVAPDQRFGMLAPLPSVATLTSGTKTLTLRHSRTVTTGTNVFKPSSVVETTFINDRAWTSSYDGPSRTFTSTSPSGRHTSTTLDAKGRPILTHTPLIADVATSYDGRGRLVSVTSGSRSSSIAYDSFDRVEHITDPLQRTVRFAYDDANRVIAKTLTDGRIVAYSYDAAGNLTAVTPPSRPVHVFTFTGIDLLESYTPPSVTSTGATVYRYNRDRQITSLTRPDGAEIARRYDPSGRLIAVTSPFGDFAIAYTPTTDLLDRISAPAVSTSYSYDGGLPTTITSSGLVNATLAIGYDNNLNVATKKVGSAPAITYGYDADGLLTSVGVESITRASENGRVTATQAGLVNDTRGYDAFGQLIDYSVSLGGSAIFAQHYGRDGAGRISSVTETTGNANTTRAFTYDAAGRLSAVAEDGVVAATYSYDDNSNRLTKVTGAGTEAGVYDEQDRVNRYGGYAFTYTPNGEIASKSSAFGTTTYRYDTFGNLVGVTLPGGHVIEYVVDARSRRVAKKVERRSDAEVCLR